jgi:hypothetical protein
MYGYYYAQRYGLLNEDTTSVAIGSIATLSAWTSNLVSSKKNGWDYGSNTASLASNTAYTALTVATRTSNVVTSLSNAVTSLSNALELTTLTVSYISNLAVTTASNLNVAIADIQTLSNVLAWASNTLTMETSNIWGRLSNCCETNSAIAAFASNTATFASNAIGLVGDTSAFASNTATFASNTLLSMYDATDGSLSIGVASNAWSVRSDLSGSSNTLVFESLAGTKVSFSDNFTSSVLNFTGSHRCSYVFDTVVGDAPELYLGCIVVSTGQYKNADDMTMYDVNDALPIVDVACRDMDNRVFGVIAGFDDGSEKPIYKLANLNFQCGTPVKKAIINSTGEGAIRVCSLAGDITNGDLIVSSRVPGCGMRQPDDIVRACTVAKSTCSVVWQNEHSLSQYVHGHVTHEDTTYTWALVGCLYAL